MNGKRMIMILNYDRGGEGCVERERERGRRRGES